MAGERLLCVCVMFVVLYMDTRENKRKDHSIRKGAVKWLGGLCGRKRCTKTQCSQRSGRRINQARIHRAKTARWGQRSSPALRVRNERRSGVSNSGAEVSHLRRFTSG